MTSYSPNHNLSCNTNQKDKEYGFLSHFAMENKLSNCPIQEASEEAFLVQEALPSWQCILFSCWGDSFTMTM